MKLFCEKPGVISSGPVWVCFYGCHMHVHESLFWLLVEVVREYKHDRHLVG